MPHVSPDRARAETSKPQWWEPVAGALAGLKLKTISITCPQCRQPGLVATRWVKGQPLKPLYTLHIRRGKVNGVCELCGQHCDQARAQVHLHESDIRNLLRTRRCFILFSGGKDSLAALVYLKKLFGPLTARLIALHVDTTAGVRQSLRYVKEVSRYLGIELRIVRPKIDYFTLAKNWGIPSFGYRWCCRELKIKPVQDYLRAIEEPKVVFDGIRAAESSLRRQYIPIWYHPGFKCLSVSPIFHWLDRDVELFIERDGIPKTLLPPAHTSTECWCGAYKTESDFRRLYDLDRDLFRRLSQLEQNNRSGYTFLYKNGERKYLHELEKTILREKLADGKSQ